MPDEPTFHTTETMRALASPLRREILTHLRKHGPATSTTIGQALGHNTGTTSYHLRLLADAGFIAEVPERAKGRERWWRVVSGDWRMPHPEQMTADEHAIADAVNRERHAEDTELLRYFDEHRAELADWSQGSRASRYMTADELRQFHDEYLKLLRRFGHDLADAPSNARLIALRWIAFPDPR